jgi:anti-sigma B factor antagonist
MSPTPFPTENGNAACRRTFLLVGYAGRKAEQAWNLNLCVRTVPSARGPAIPAVSRQLRVAQAESDCIGKKSLAQQSARRKKGPRMDISTRQVGSTTIVDVVGEITLYNSPEMRKTLIDLLKEKRLPRVIVNLGRVKYIDSAGVASLVEGLKISRDLKSGFALYGLSRTAREVLELTKLINVFEVHDSEEEALRGGGSTPSAK